MMFSKALTTAVTHAPSTSIRCVLGWEVRVAEDSDVVRRTCYSDWHRVERAISAIEREVSTLEAQGWQPVRTGATAT